MPTGSHGGEYKGLFEAYNNNKERFGETYRIVSRSNEYVYAEIWASTSYKNISGSSYFSDSMFYGDYVNVLTYHGDRKSGNAIRCILKVE